MQAMGTVDREFESDDTIPNVKDIEYMLRQAVENCLDQAKSALLLQVGLSLEPFRCVQSKDGLRPSVVSSAQQQHGNDPWRLEQVKIDHEDADSACFADWTDRPDAAVDHVVLDTDGSDDHLKLMDSLNSTRCSAMVNVRSVAKAVIASHRLQKICAPPSRRPSTVNSPGEEEHTINQPVLPIKVHDFFLFSGEHQEDDDSDDEMDSSQRVSNRSNRSTRMTSAGRCSAGRKALIGDANDDDYIPGRISVLMKEKEKMRQSALDGAMKWYDHIVFPSRNKPCMMWDAWTGLCVAYDLFMAPMAAFQMEKTPVLAAIDHVIFATWLVDMVLSFVRGFMRFNGMDERRLFVVVRRYLTSWFAFDFLLVSLDMFLYVADEEDSFMKYMTVLRLIRLLRMLRVLRLLKMQERLRTLAYVLQMTTESRLSETGNVMWYLTKNIFIIVVINHFLACVWYAIGTVGQEGQGGWVLEHNRRYDRDVGVPYLYFTSFHWALTQVTPASMEVVPTSTWERCFNVVMIILGLCTFSTFVGSLTQVFAQLRLLSARDREKLETMRRYMAENKISVSLASTIAHWVRQRPPDETKQRLRMDEIDMFSSFPEFLLTKIRVEACKNVTAKHTFFEFAVSVDSSIFTSLCTKAMEEQSHAMGHTVFDFNDEGVGMYFVTNGQLNYLAGDLTKFEFTDDWLELTSPSSTINMSKSVERGRMISETALWLDWHHKGRLMGDTALVDVLLVYAEGFREVIVASGYFKDYKLYARLFALRTLGIHREGEVVDDLWHQEDTITEIGRLSLWGGLEESLNALRQGFTPETVFKAWAAVTAFKKRCCLSHFDKLRAKLGWKSLKKKRAAKTPRAGKKASIMRQAS